MSSNPKRTQPPSRRRAAMLAPLLLCLGFQAAAPSPSRAEAVPDGPPTAVAGTVLDEGSKPLAGAEITLHRQLGEDERAALLLAGEAYGEPAARAITGTDGRFRLDPPGSGLWIVLARAPERLPLAQHLAPLLPSPPGAPDRPVELAPVALPGGAPAVFRIVDSEGRPVPGAVVEAWGPESYRTNEPRRYAEGWSASKRVAIADADGTVRLVVPAEGEITVRAHDGVRFGWLAIDAEEVRDGAIRLAVETPPTARLRVARSDGRPARGALVWTDRGPVGRTGEDGWIHVPLPLERRTRLHAASEDRSRTSTRLDPAEENAIEPLYVTLQAPFPVDGRVVDATTGAAVPGALVWLRNEPSDAVSADDGGRFRLGGTGEPARVVLHATAPGFGEAAREPAREGGGMAPETTLELSPAWWIRGSVTDAAGDPLQGARVEAVPEDRSGRLDLSTGSIARTWTAPDGGFLLTGLDTEARHRVTAYSEGRAPAIERVAPPSAGDPGRSPSAQALALTLHPSIRVTGRAVDDQGQPLAGALATLFPENRLGEDELWLSIDDCTRTAGDDGRFVFDDPFPAPSLLVVRADGRAPHIRSGIEIDPTGGGVDLGDAVLFPEGVIRGRVVDGEGQPIAGAAIHEQVVGTPSLLRDLFDGARLGVPVASTDERGEFSAGGFLPGEPLQLQACRAEAVSEKQWTYAAPEPLPIELVLLAPARITGTVVDAEGRPVAGAAVAPHYESRPGVSHFDWTRTDEAGRFQVTVAEPGRAILVAQARGHARSEPVEVEVSGGETIGEIELALRRGHVLRGRVVDSAGHPIEGVELSAHPGSRVVWTDADGRFAIEDRPAGTVRLDLRREGYLPHEIPVELVPGGDAAEVLFPNAEVAGTLRTADGAPAGGYTIQLSPWDSPTLVAEALQVTTAADGSFRFRGVADGEHLVKVFGPDRPPYGWNRPEPVVVEGGRSVTDLDVTLPDPEALTDR